MSKLIIDGNFYIIRYALLPEDFLNDEDNPDLNSLCGKLEQASALLEIHGVELDSIKLLLDKGMSEFSLDRVIPSNNIDFNEDILKDNKTYFVDIRKCKGSRCYEFEGDLDYDKLSIVETEGLIAGGADMFLLQDIKYINATPTDSMGSVTRQVYIYSDGEWFHHKSGPRLTITGPFQRTVIAEISQENANNLLNGNCDKHDFLEKIEETPSYQSVYGSEDPTITLDGLEILDTSDLEELAEENEEGDDASIYLDKQPVNKYFFIFRELYEGDEHLDLPGEFNQSLLSVSRISVWAEDEITDVFAISYKDADIVDETSPEDKDFWLYHNGTLSML